MPIDHCYGFEKELKFQDILSQAQYDSPYIKARTVKLIIERVAPEFTEGLFEQRPCVRKLKYAGCGDICCEFPVQDCPHHDGLTPGKIYTSKTYNGAMYFLDGFEIPFGAIFFEIVPD